jgi:hypothetical protein
MLNAIRSGAAIVLAGLLGACASSRIPREAVAASNPEALAVLTASQRAHGAAAFATIRDLNLRSAGTWSTLGSRSQPVLADRRYRRESEEALDLTTGTTVHLHKGPGGRKFVFRAPGRVTVWYNGQPDGREEVKRAAALVADAEKMFLLGPLYFDRPGVMLSALEPAPVNGSECDRVLAVLRPGFGFADEDRVVLSIDRQNQRLRRVLMTLNGLKKAKGAELEVTFGNWAQRSGVWWATEYNERFPSMLKLHAHRWKLLDLKANRGFTPRHPELLGEVLGEVAGQVR